MKVLGREKALDNPKDPAVVAKGRDVAHLVALFVCASVSALRVSLLILREAAPTFPKCRLIFCVKPTCP